MKILYFGIYTQGLVTLKRLVEENFDVGAVVTKTSDDGADQPVAQWARSKGLPVLEPQSTKSEAFLAQVRELSPELIVVSAYHKVIPETVLGVPGMGAINVHGSLLPKYRGPNPHKWAIVRGEMVTGVTIHEMTPELDSGDILAQESVAIKEDDNGEALFLRLAATGAELLVRTLETIQSGGKLEKIAQDQEAATYYSYPTDADTHINWNESSRSISAFVRGWAPRPGAWTLLGAQKLRAWRAALVAESPHAAAGTIVPSNNGAIRVATADGIIQLDQISLDGVTARSDSIGKDLWNLNGMRLD